MADVLGLLTLLAVAAGLVCLLAAGGLVHVLRHPPRKTYAVALGRGNPTEPEQLDLTGESATFRLADGSASPAWFIRGERAGAGDAAGGGRPGPVVIVSHGFGDSRYGALTWAPLLVPFASELVLFDQRGHGEAEGVATIAGDREAEDLAAVIDQALARQGERHEHARAARAASDAPGGAPEHPSAASKSADQPEAVPPVVVFGYSRGATIALAAAARDPRIAGVIADGAYRHWHEPVRQTMHRRRYPTEPMLALVRAGLWLCGGGGAAPDHVTEARRLACPLLMLHGSDDPCCSIEAARTIVEAASDGELVVFDGGGHLDLAERDSQRYRDALARFFERVAAR